MNLGDWITTLAALPGDAPVKYADGRNPGRLRSWRGDYAELTLDSGDARTVAELLADARKAVGGTFEGYKGGSYTMDEHTAVWADEWGEYHCSGITGVRVSDGEVVIATVDLSDYR